MSETEAPAAPEVQPREAHDVKRARWLTLVLRGCYSLLLVGVLGWVQAVVQNARSATDLGQSPQRALRSQRRTRPGTCIPQPISARGRNVRSAANAARGPERALRLPDRAQS